MLDFLTGASCVFRGIPLLLRPGVRRYVIAPLLINLLAFVALVWFGISQFAGLLAWLETVLPAWLSWLDWLLWPLFVLVAVLAGFVVCLLLATLVAAPFTGPLAAAVETRLRGRAPSSEGGFIMESAAALAGEARKLGYFALRAAPLGLLTLVPGVNLVAVPLWLLFSAWMLALEYAEVPLGNHGLTFPAVRARLAQRRMLALGFGATLLVLTLIPLVNLLVMPIAVAGATVLVCEEGEASGVRGEA
ncbi:MAG: sulfate transporter CysZ [Gammaproteobacteria bacterium]|nr:sulfate transporter CysZ [Gammaproteobacteria bacterium]